MNSRLYDLVLALQKKLQAALNDHTRQREPRRLEVGYNALNKRYPNFELSLPTGPGTPRYGYWLASAEYSCKVQELEENVEHVETTFTLRAVFHFFDDERSEWDPKTMQQFEFSVPVRFVNHGWDLASSLETPQGKVFVEQLAALYVQAHRATPTPSTLPKRKRTHEP